jgi:hypothetical protein
VLFDVEHNGAWHHSWGARPQDTVAAIDVAHRRLTVVPRLVPVYAHRFLPAGRGTSGHPVLSVWRTDIIYYGKDLAHYIGRELKPPDPDAEWRATSTVPFWCDFL